MTGEELKDLLKTIQRTKCETQTLELKPLFEDQRGQFSVTFFNTSDNHPAKAELDDKASGLIEFCRTPRTRQEIADYLGLSSISYAIKDYVMPLVDNGLIKLSIPDKPRSPKQLYFSE